MLRWSRRRSVRGFTALILFVASGTMLLASVHLARAASPTITITGYIAPTAPITVNGLAYSI
jgi:hypothetical protein